MFVGCLQHVVGVVLQDIVGVVHSTLWVWFCRMLWVCSYDVVGVVFQDAVGVFAGCCGCLQDVVGVTLHDVGVCRMLWVC